MKHRKTLIAAAVASLVALGGSALANDKSHSSGTAFNSLDTNGDGRISKAEAAADSTIMFSSADANGAGYLDKSEYKKAMKSSSKDDGSMSPQPQSQPQSTTPSTEPGQTDTAPPQDQSAP